MSVWTCKRSKTPRRCRAAEAVCKLHRSALQAAGTSVKLPATPRRCTHQSRAALMTIRLAEKRPTVSAVTMPISAATARMYCMYLRPAHAG